jgi:membrane-associated protein
LEILRSLIDIFFHLDVHLNDWVTYMGPWIYVLLFIIIFCETGLVITPFLPGDSLLFALGALSAIENSALNFSTLAITLLVAGFWGDSVNYSIGRYFAPYLFRRGLLKQRHLDRTHRFYDRHGGKTIVLARFVPIVRTFAPFVAGMARMQYRQFVLFNVSGAVLWIMGFLAAGYQFGNQPTVKRNFHFVIVAIIFLSVVPVLIEIIRARNLATRKSADGPAQ